MYIIRAAITLLAASLVQPAITQFQRLSRKWPNLKWTCAANASGFPYDLEAVSGVWYEVAHVPNIRVSSCLNVYLPATIVNDTYNLQVEYVNNVNGEWEPTHETVSFPWNNATQGGVFELNYGNPNAQIKVIFKLMFTDYKTIALLCGYTYVSPMPMFKLLTRERELNPQYMTKIQKMVDDLGVGSYFMWDEQSLARCSAAIEKQSVYLVTIAAFFAVIKRFCY